MAALHLATRPSALLRAVLQSAAIKTPESRMIEIVPFREDYRSVIVYLILPIQQKEFTFCAMTSIFS
jgi:hypothetical protein